MPARSPHYLYFNERQAGKLGLSFFKVFWYDLTWEVNPRSNDCEADALTITPSHRLVKGCGQIKAVGADPICGDVGDKAGNEETSVEMQEVNDCEGTRSANNGAAKKKRLFLKIPKISLGKAKVPKQMTTRKTRLLSKIQRKLTMSPEKKRLLLIKQKKTEETPSQLED